jgi:hypothetical protein
MSPIHRKPRPLKRDADSLRDDRLFIVACDDTYAAKQYFDLMGMSLTQVAPICSMRRWWKSIRVI